MILKTVNLTKEFGSLRAVDNVNLEINEGETRAIIGPNGAGKSTLLDLITNRTKPSSGKIFFKNEEITNLPPYTITSKKIAKCFQISKLFPELTAFENIEIACISRLGKVHNMFASRNKSIIQRVTNTLASVGLTDMTEELAGYLS
jgi:branched-chain amino acid transport system ATP-binding protein